MESTSDSDFKDLANGCVLGAFIGDALGSYLEFQEKVTGSQVDTAMKMPGGGPFNLSPGQITDDSELALCLGHGLVAGEGKLDLNKIAEQYRNWINSGPFDVGITIGSALRVPEGDKEDLAKRIRAASVYSKKSQSNGGLMRITPLCIWASKLSRDDLIKAVREETRLTHPNETAINASIAYVYTIQHLLNNKGDYKGAYKKCQEIVDHLGDSELQSWMENIDKGEEKLPQANHLIGWAKIAFSYSVFYLKYNMNYSEAMRDLLRRGGDTDTNCAIAGGMLGALHGESKLPSEYVKKVLEVDTKENVRHKRPEFLTPKHFLRKIIENIIKIRPSKLEMVGEETESERANAPKTEYKFSDFKKQ